MVSNPVDPTYQPPAHIVEAGGQPVAVQPDGRVIYSGGARLDIGGRLQEGIFRLHGDGSLDSSYYVGNSISVTEFHPLSDNKSLLWETISDADSEAFSGFTRLLEDGSVDPSLQIFTGVISQVFLKPDGGILISERIGGGGGEGRFEVYYLSVDVEVTAQDTYQDKLTDNGGNSYRNTLTEYLQIFVTGQGQIGTVTRTSNSWIHPWGYPSTTVSIIGVGGGVLEPILGVTYGPPPVTVTEIVPSPSGGVFFKWGNPYYSGYTYTDALRLPHLSESGELTEIAHGFQETTDLGFPALPGYYEYTGDFEVFALSTGGAVIVGDELRDNPNPLVAGSNPAGPTSILPSRTFLNESSSIG